MQKTKAKITRLRQPDSSSSPKSGLHPPTKKRWAAKTTQRKRNHLREVPNPQPAEPEPEPVFSHYTLRGPDGKERAGWVLYINGVLIGRAESKEHLLEYYTRLAEPLSSNHWRDSLVRHRTRRDPIAQSSAEGHNAEAEADLTAEKSDEDLRATA
jgi:hypothetical protein